VLCVVSVVRALRAASGDGRSRIADGMQLESRACAL
jgi:hypothetical protein